LDGTVPKPDTVGSAIQEAFAGLKLVSISLGLNHACGLTADSSVYCQGANASGQLGDGSGDRETYDAVRVRLSP
jgi:alpha-tubulin suppressor-like RCC1 family protein